MTYSKSEIKKLTTALEIYSQLTANKYKETEIQDVEFSSIFEKKMEKLINRQKKPYFYLINTVAKRIAIIIAVIIIALTSTVLSVDALREKIKNFVIETFDNFSIISQVEPSSNTDVIEEYYIPSYIPTGYEISQKTRGTNDSFILYKNNNGDIIYFTQINLNYKQAYIDTQDCIIEEIDNYLFIKKENANRTAMYFNDKNYYYEIVSFGSLPKEELLKMAESIKKSE